MALLKKKNVGILLKHSFAVFCFFFVNIFLTECAELSE